MSIILRDVYEETRNRFGLKLIAGEKGLSSAMNWVYIAESFVGPGYLSGGELIITTGVLCRESPDWLYHFIESMISEHTCGLILNIGRYIWPAYITADIIGLCNRHNYPLFTMPWETLITDVTRNYYNRIFEDNQKNEVITSAFLDLVHGRGEQAASLSLLAEHGCDPSADYCVMYIRFHPKETQDQERKRTEARIRLILSRQIREHHLSAYLCSTKEYFLLVFQMGPQQKEEQIRTFGVLLLRLLCNRFPMLEIYAGCGSISHSLSGLSKSFFHARTAAEYASLFLKEEEKHFISFQELGFYQILLSVPDREILKSYSDSRLEAVLAFDREHHSSFADTLREYLRCGSSVQTAAEHLFCHRNTINKRVRILREELHYDLDNPQVIFELYAAFLIRDFLKHFPN